MSRYLVDRIERSPVVGSCSTPRCGRSRASDGNLEGVEVEDNRTGERRTIPARALFVFIGAAPARGWLDVQLALDEGGYVLTGDERRCARTGRPGRRPLPLETSRPGVFAVGDVRSGSIKRVASAVGEGAMAVRLVHQHLARR